MSYFSIISTVIIFLSFGLRRSFFVSSNEECLKCDCSSIEEVMGKLDRIEKLLILQNSKTEETLFKKIKSMFPSTDANCSYNWSAGNCHPSSICVFKPKLGDLTIGRMCRLRAPDDATKQQANEAEDSLNAFHTSEGVLKKLHQLTKTTISNVVARIVDNAPYSDDICSWNMRSLRCVPEMYCAFDYQVGDYSLHRACRLRTDTQQDDDEGDDEDDEERDEEDLSFVLGEGDVDEENEDDMEQDEDHDVSIHIGPIGVTVGGDSENANSR